MGTNRMAAMTIIRFLALPKEEQWEELWDKCTFLEHYVDTGVKYYLYRLHDFYEELTSDGTNGLNNTLAVFKDGQ